MKQLVQYFEKHLKQTLRRFLYLGMLCTFCCTAFFACKKAEDDAVVVLGNPSLVSETASEQEETEVPISGQEEQLFNEAVTGQKEQGTLFVYVCGAVENPGVYTLAAGARICDAIDAAGGMTGDAAKEYWNLAELLSDGDMIYIPTIDEAKEREKETMAAPSPGRNSSNEESVKGESTLVNINTASEKQLMELPGIGEARAAGILAYRQEHGSFSDVSEITKVSGIGNALYENIKEKITVN